MPSSVFRGVHAQHPGLADAINGQVQPGDPNGAVTEAMHNLGGVSEESPFTSWTHDRAVAVTHALKQGSGGVVLDVSTGPPANGAQWSWAISPDVWCEQEVLLKGPRSGLGVSQP